MDIHSHAGEHFNCVQSLAIADKAAMDISVQVFVGTHAVIWVNT